VKQLGGMILILREMIAKSRRVTVPKPAAGVIPAPLASHEFVEELVMFLQAPKELCFPFDSGALGTGEYYCGGEQGAKPMVCVSLVQKVDQLVPLG
jgi:hypothetical protein